MSGRDRRSKLGTICIVSPGNLASNPRLLKEADALHEAGYVVTAVVCDNTTALRPFDDAIAAGVPWQVVRVPPRRGERAIGLLSRALARLAGGRVPVTVAARAYGGPVGVLASAIGPAVDLYIGHYIAGLAAAGRAARRHGAMLGFDAEDLHAGEGGPLQMGMARIIEGSFLPSCRHVTASAPLIGAALRDCYGVTATTVLNVFPLSMAPAAPVAASGRGTLKAYWFSQTIGLDRGLQPFIAAMARTRTRVTLDIRGSNRWGHGKDLVELARSLGIADRINVLPVASPQEMVTLAAHYDLGLSLEAEVSVNRGLCLTNKIFTYLLTGVPVLLSDTPAQRAIAAELGVAARVVSLTDPDGMAAILDRLADSSVERSRASTEAWRLGRERYNWDFEKSFLLKSVARAFETRRGPG
jgi:hypothetical protein